MWMGVTLAATPGWAQTASQTLRLPSILSDHMVLQREMAVPVWGWADGGATVTVSFQGQKESVTADATGRWRVNLKPLRGDAQPAEMTITSGVQTVTIRDVVVGEVWLCSGQSNMEWAVKNVDNAEPEIAAAGWPLIRHIKAPRQPNMRPQEDVEAQWAACSPETVGSFTAVGYFFGRKLHQELNVPIGLVNCSWGGTRIEPWTPIEGFAATPPLQTIHEKVLTKQPDSAAYHAQAQAYLDAMEAWLTQSQKNLAGQQAIEPPVAFPDAIAPFTNHQDPTMLYNGLMEPFTPFAIRGSLWYQGESNHGDGMLYVDKTKALLAGWRLKWERPDLPYYFVQIAPHQYGSENPHVLPTFWEAQTAITDQIEHTGMVVVADVVGNLQDIHPRNKQDVGLRLANLALKRDYGRKDILERSPRFASMTVNGDALILKFDFVGAGLKSRDGQPLTAFEIAGEAQPWTAATAAITAPDTVTLKAQGIAKPVAVRFAWHKIAVWNLVNSAGLPAEPFRAGEPPKLDALSLNVPEAKDYQTVFELDLSKLGKDIAYDIDKRTDVAQPFDRVAYYLELTDSQGQLQWVFVAMDAFTGDLSKIGIPTVASQACFQQNVAHVSVRSNLPGLPNADNLAGNLEFWPNNYTKGNAARIPNAKGDAYDTGDQMDKNVVAGYGCMQIHLLEPSVTVLAINNWKAGPNADIGIGDNKTGGEPDWTFTQSAQRYTGKRLVVMVHPTP
jgi:sialate O-acetylesterase